MKTVIKTILLLFTALPAYTQVKELTIGDKTPDITFEDVINHPSTKMKLSDFKGQLILLDFWSTYCSPCVAAFPKLDSLQNQFKGKFQVIPITIESREKITAFMKKNKFLKKTSLPIVVADKKLKHYFPHVGVPHEVWIGADGIIKAITSAQYIKAENIQKLLDNEKVDWAVRQRNLSYQYGQPLLQPVDNGAGLPAAYYYSTLTGYIAGGVVTTAGLKTDTLNGTVRNYAINVPLLNLYSITLKQTPLKGNHNRFILEVKDSSRFIYDESKEYRTDWLTKNAYCYEALLPKGTGTDQVYEFMRTDLNKFLNLNGRIEKRLIRCLLLVNAVVPKDNPPQAIVHDTLPQYTYRSAKELLRIFNLQKDLLPVLDETDANKSFFVKMPQSKNIEELRKYLRPYSLDLVEAKRELEVFVLSDN